MKSGKVSSQAVSFEAAKAMSPRSPQAADSTCWSHEIAAVARERDRDSFLRLYDYFQPRVQRYLMSLGAPLAIAEDLAQETLLRLWQRAGSYDGARSNVSTWLFRIARNLFIDRVRRESHWSDMQTALESSDTLEGGNRTTDAEAYAAHSELYVRLRQLPAVQARLIRMSYFEGKTHQEIAAELDMPLGSVKSNLRRAFLKLQIAVGKPS